MGDNERTLHVPVMVEEVLTHLQIGEARTLVDATLGEGGHSARLLSENPALRVVGVDADVAMLNRARRRLAEFDARVEYHHRWFDEFFAEYSGEPFDRILMDLGVSMYHFAGSGRGFSFREAEPLDMRLSGAGPTAADIVRDSGERELRDIIGTYGEERYAGRIARAIAEARSTRPIADSRRLAEVVAGAVPRNYRYGRFHPATRTFQALRIAVNNELDRLRRGLEAAVRGLADDGIIAVISFHSLEDRIVKHLFRSYGPGAEGPMEKEGDEAIGWPALDVVTKKPVRPGESEVAENPPSRSAKLRVARRRRVGEEDRRGS